MNKTKHILLTAIMLLCSLATSAQTKVEIDGIWYNLVPKAKQAEVTYKGSSYKEYYDEYSGSITIPATVTYEGVDYRVASIGERAFSACNSLTSITIPESVTSIESGVFYGCTSLTIITIPESVTSIESGVFRDCSNLTSITIPEGVTSIGAEAFRNCTSLTTITLPESVTSIGGYAFSGCSGLTTINIPEGVTSIGVYAFSGCSGLTTINIPESVTSIGYGAFSDCKSLTAIVLPKNLKNIYSQAFANCGELLDVCCYAEKVPSAEADAFDGSYPEYITLHVPENAIEEYKDTEPWCQFGTIKTIENVTLEKCATPTIGYADGKVVFACDTEGATVKSSIKENITGDYRDMEVAFVPTYTITAYATKEHYEDSDVATLTLCWLPCTEEHESEEAGILTIPAKPVLISTQGGTIIVSGLADGTEVTVCSTAGTQLDTATATDGTATLTTDLTAGDIAIVKIDSYTVKVVIK